MFPRNSLYLSNVFFMKLRCILDSVYNDYLMKCNGELSKFSEYAFAWLTTFDIDKKSLSVFRIVKINY